MYTVYNTNIKENIYFDSFKYNITLYKNLCSNIVFLDTKYIYLYRVYRYITILNIVDFHMVLFLYKIHTVSSVCE